MTGSEQAPGTPDAAAVTSAVTGSFAFGWQMARLYTGPMSSAAEPQLAEDLPGLSDLPAAQLVKLGLAQADMALSRLKAVLGDAPLPTTDTVREETEKSSPDRDAIRKAILNLHISVLVQLMAADYRLGKAYGLGRAMADTCASAHGDETARRQALVHHLEPHRALVLLAWLDDLKTVFPAHASHGVADSCSAGNAGPSQPVSRRLIPPPSTTPRVCCTVAARRGGRSFPARKWPPTCWR
jgi:hypothetical protein